MPFSPFSKLNLAISKLSKNKLSHALLSASLVIVAVGCSNNAADATSSTGIVNSAQAKTTKTVGNSDGAVVKALQANLKASGIEEKIISNNSPFKEVKELKSLFTRSTSQHIDNLAKLLEVCQKAEMINMDYDIKFKLRYLISNVLLYGKNSY